MEKMGRARGGSGKTEREKLIGGRGEWERWVKMRRWEVEWET